MKNYYDVVLMYMTKTKLAKITIDILMYADFIFLMSHGTVRNLGFHAYAGIGLFGLFLIHHLLNLWFYKVAFKGKFNAKRIMLNVIDWILFVLMILMAVSSVFASGAVFEWSPFRFNQTWRTIHLMSTSWGFIVMSFHLGLHLKLKKFGHKIPMLLLYTILILAGCFAFWKSQIYIYIFNTGNWKMAAPNLFISILEYVGITAGVCSVYQIINKLSNIVGEKTC